MEEETSNYLCANEGKKRKSKTFCVAGGPNKKPCTNSGDTPGINMHRSPKDPTVRKQWVRFVQRHRSDFNPAKYSSNIFLSSAHFNQTCYSMRFASNLEGFDSSNSKRFLNRGSVPTIDVQDNKDDVCISAKKKRLVSTV